MRETLASTLILLGGLVAAVAGTVGWIPAYRMARAQWSSRVEPARRRVAVAAEFFWMMMVAAIAAVGLCVVIGAGVLGFGWPAWSPTLPLGILAGCVILAVWARVYSRRSS